MGAAQMIDDTKNIVTDEELLERAAALDSWQVKRRREEAKQERLERIKRSPEYQRQRALSGMRLEGIKKRENEIDQLKYRVSGLESVVAKVQSCVMELKSELLRELRRVQAVPKKDKLKAKNLPVKKQSDPGVEVNDAAPF